ncbi:MAG: DNA/RNA helicase [Spirochaetaceae bacterium]|nr:MAG: DNA/RNA helicase [Spirochaetaceae bacterium]
MSHYLEGLNDQQKQAVLHTGSPLLILAGAGSGKTRVITVKIAYLIDQLGVSPQSILAVTFTNRAAAEMRHRAAAMEPAAVNVMIRTFHSFGAWLLRRNAHLLDMPSGFTIYDDDDSTTLLRSLFPEQTRSALAPIARRIARAKDYGLTPEDDLRLISSDPEFRRFYAAYDQRLRQIGNADFGDLIGRPIELLRANPDVAARLRDRFSVILVDEYQDSNVAQFALLRELVGAASYLCVVGDDDQSIYRFRGAEVRNILTFSESFPGTQLVRLEENYRSTSAILHVASSVVAYNQGRLGKTLWTRRAGGARPVLAYLDSEEQEVRYCMAVLTGEMEEQGAGGISAAETAILYRTNAQSRLFETAFLRAEINYRIVGTLRFYEREEIKDAVAWLKLLANPRDEVSFRRIVNKPARGLGDKSVARIIECLAAGDGDIRAACRSARSTAAARTAAALGGFLAIVDALQQSFGSRTLADLVERMISVSGLAGHHQDQDEVAGSQRLQNLEELVNAASLYPPSREGLIEFLEAIELDSARQSDQQDGQERVTLITMHNTKGLEFDRVIITGLEEGLFPRADRVSPDQVDDLEEERRLFYVALTRARRSLHMTSCRSRRVHGRVMDLYPSRFVREIPADALEVRGERGPASVADDGYDPGVYVYHDDYGTGVIVKRWQTGANAVVLVRFETGRTAQFLPRYTQLERVSGEY